MAVKRMDNVGIAVDDLDATLAKLRTRGARLVGEVVDYEGVYRLCYIRGPEGLLIGLAQELGCAQEERPSVAPYPTASWPGLTRPPSRGRSGAVVTETPPTQLR